MKKKQTQIRLLESLKKKVMSKAKPLGYTFSTVVTMLLNEWVGDEK